MIIIAVIITLYLWVSALCIFISLNNKYSKYYLLKNFKLLYILPQAPDVAQQSCKLSVWNPIYYITFMKKTSWTQHGDPMLYNLYKMTVITYPELVMPC